MPRSGLAGRATDRSLKHTRTLAASRAGADSDTPHTRALADAAPQGVPRILRAYKFDRF